MSLRRRLIIPAMILAYLSGGVLGIIGLASGFLGAFSPCPFVTKETPAIIETAVRSVCFMTAITMGLIVVSLFGLAAGNPELMFVKEWIEFWKTIPVLYFSFYVLGIIIWVFGEQP